MHKSEKEFANFLKSQNKSYIYQPKTFRFNDTNYRPDFYCPEDNTYYEVKRCLGLSEAIRLLNFKKFHPHIKFKIVSPNGYPYHSRSSGECLEIIEKKLNILKSKDILEISFNEFLENAKEFHILKKAKHGNDTKMFRVNVAMMKKLNEIKKI